MGHAGLKPRLLCLPNARIEILHHHATTQASNIQKLNLLYAGIGTEWVFYSCDLEMT